ncbi:MAG: hypothetical protein E2586_20835 [Novosphingobium sp.]|uniref:phage/plasmid primase, P4 family n=1 Tax=Novosphingobium sp. TaxID=1874826 RepID=UPI0012C1F695|nr:phage/plasmid primase, P4 family [Novosphingobium sp.]MPS70928.1 hypothetical protein [Novosphingobium sp.]
MTDRIFENYAPLYWNAGLPVIPLRHRNKMPDITQWSQYGSAMPTETEMRDWLASYPDGNIGLPFGPKSGLCAIDIDTEDEDLIAAILDALPPTPWTRVGKKGMGLIYRFEGQKNFKLRGPDGGMVLEFLGLGNQMVMPPSIHPDTGRPYTSDTNLWEVLGQIEPLGEDIEDRLRGLLGLKRVPAKYTMPSEKIGEGGRHTALASFAGKLRQIGMTGEDLRAALKTFMDTRFESRLPEHQVDGIIRHATEVWEGGDGHEHSDVGNGRRLAVRLKDKLLWNGSSWLAWSGGKWSEDCFGLIDMEAKALTDDLLGSKDDTTKSWGLKSQSSRAIRAMIEMAKSERDVVVRPDTFDRDPDILNTPTGVVDLRTGSQRTAVPSDMLALQTSVGYDPEAECPAFIRFINEIFPDPEVVDFVQRWCGYLLTGRTREQVFLIASGAGSNGKSTLLNIIREILGDYACNTPISTFLERDRGAATNDLAALQGARLVLANEGNRSDALDSALVKKMTGGDPITARFLHKEFITYTPQFKPVIISNHIPEIDATDPAIWRRTLILPFTRNFNESERDADLPKKLEAEASGILRWAVEGAKTWFMQGLCPPATITNTVRAFQEDMDTVGAFIKEMCSTSQTTECSASAIYLAFDRFSRELGLRPMSSTQFGKELGKRGFEKRKSGGKILRRGLTLLPQL